MAMAYVVSAPRELAEEALKAQTIWFIAGPGEPTVYIPAHVPRPESREHRWPHSADNRGALPPPVCSIEAPTGRRPPTCIGGGDLTHSL